MKTIAEFLGLEPGEPLVLRLFSGAEFFSRLLGGVLDGETGEQAAALDQVATRAAAGALQGCFLCHAPTEVPDVIGTLRGARTGGGATIIICRGCSGDRTIVEIQAAVLEAPGEEELKSPSSRLN